jgi:hypothetical protein
MKIAIFVKNYYILHIIAVYGGTSRFKSRLHFWDHIKGKLSKNKDDEPMRLTFMGTSENIGAVYMTLQILN